MTENICHGFVRVSGHPALTHEEEGSQVSEDSSDESSEEETKSGRASKKDRIPWQNMQPLSGAAQALTLGQQLCRQKIPGIGS